MYFVFLSSNKWCCPAVPRILLLLEIYCAIVLLIKYVLSLVTVFGHNIIIITEHLQPHPTEVI